MPLEPQINEPKNVVINPPQPPTREYVQTESVYVEPRGYSGLAVAALVIGAVALVTVLFLTLMNNRTDDNTNARNDTVAREAQQTQPPIVVQQPAAQQPIVVQQPAPASSQPIIVQAPPPPANTSTNSAEWDRWIEMEFERQLMDDQTMAGLAVTATSVGNKVTLKGTVASAKLKSDVEKLTRAIQGVKDIDNQIVVTP
jgi:hypothetical protein